MEGINKEKRVKAVALVTCEENLKMTILFFYAGRKPL